MLFVQKVSQWRNSMATKIKRSAQPKLGTLNQHAPIDLVLPAWYGKEKFPTNPPRISIVTPSYRQAAFIERTLQSVLDQGYPNLEYFVQDGCSKDGTEEILDRYAHRLSGWQSKPDDGQSNAINLGMGRTTGEIMAWINSDDILFPGSLAYIAQYFAAHPEIDVVYGHRLLIDENDRQIGRWIMPAHDDNILSWADFVPQETLFWRREIWNKAGGRIDESFRFAMDWDLLVRFRSAGAKFARLPRLLGGFRIHTEQKTSTAISDIGFKEMARIRERALGKNPTHVEISRAIAPYLIRHLVSDLVWRLRRD
ncbi:MAG: glycosyltransferase [Gammaproteobacteria bacterium]|nr:MAG: glycosyltransferase [Gammaproteobacteria bacterium]